MPPKDSIQPSSHRVRGRTNPEERVSLIESLHESIPRDQVIIATDVVNRYGIDPVRMLFVEHYSESQRPRPYGESYDLVTFTRDGKRATNPDWRHLPPAEFDEILNAVKS